MTLDPDLRSRSILHLVERKTLLDAGLTSKAIEHHLRRGDLHRIHRGIYSFEPPPLRPGARELAAVLACGPQAALSHRPATVHYGLLPDRGGPLHVTTPVHRTGPPGITVHRANPERTTHRHVPITTPARTLLDLAATSPDELERALNEARIQKLVTDDSLNARLQTPHRGTATLRAALQNGPTLHRSPPELELQRLLNRARLPRPQTNARVAGYEVDLLFPEARLVLEVDGYAYHSTPRAFERDRRKDQDLQSAGYRVLRLTARQVFEQPEATIATVARNLAP